MRTVAITALGSAALALAGCGAAPRPVASSSPPGLAYVCDGGETAYADYHAVRGIHSALVSYRNETWNMAAVGQPGRYAVQNRQWQVGVQPGREEAVLTALGAKSAVIAKCRRTGDLSPAAAALPPPGSAPDCTAASLSLKFAGEDAGAGQRWDTFAISNRGLAACAVQGFPEVALLGADGQPVKGVKVETSLQAGPGAGPAERIELKPGARAVFYMHWTPIPSGEETCPQVTRLKATTPGGRTGLVPLAATPCGGQTTISPLRKDPGTAAGERG